jgi:hypothetical protein
MQSGSLDVELVQPPTVGVKTRAAASGAYGVLVSASAAGDAASAPITTMRVAAALATDLGVPPITAQNLHHAANGSADMQ